jgi:putative RecB family exonuclease
MSLPLPATLSPSKVASFKDCALAFKFSAIDRLPEPPSIPATRGTLVHLALQHLFGLPNHERTVDAALACLEQATGELRSDPEYSGLELDAEAEAVFLAEAEQLVRRYFELEDPTSINPIGIELMLEARVGDLRLRGIIDRLELDADGELVVTDYKTGRAPIERYEQGRLGGVHFY